MAMRLVLRGGAGAAAGTAQFLSEDPRPSGPVRHLVPKEYESLAECIYDVRCGDTVFLQGLPHTYRTIEGGEWGWHSWMGQVYVTNECLWRSRKKGFPHSGAKTLDELRAYYREADKIGRGLIRLEQTVIRGAGEVFFAGAPGVKVSGQLVLCENTTGAFQGPMTLALFTDINFLTEEAELRYVTDFKAAVSVWGVGWSFDNCHIRASGGTALRCDRASRVKLEGCAVGGLLAYDVDGRLCKASYAVSAIRNATCVMVGCSIEHTEFHKYSFKGGVGVKLSQQAEVVLEDSIMHSHDGVGVIFEQFDDLGERYNNSARMRISNSVIKQCGISTFSSRGNTSAALLRVKHSKMYGTEMWANEDRPGQLDLQDNQHFAAAQPPGNGHAGPAGEHFRSLYSYKPKSADLTGYTDEVRQGRIDWKRWLEVDTLTDSEEASDRDKRDDGDGSARLPNLEPPQGEEKARARRMLERQFQDMRARGFDVDAMHTNKRTKGTHVV
jgi:hypothetical protein